jgi:hypothetical protein
MLVDGAARRNAASRADGVEGAVEPVEDHLVRPYSEPTWQCSPEPSAVVNRASVVRAVMARWSTSGWPVRNLVVLGVHGQCRGDEPVGQTLQRVCRCAPDEVGVGGATDGPHPVVESPPDLRLHARFQRHEPIRLSATAGEDHLHHRCRDRVAVGLMQVEDPVLRPT